MNELFLKSQSVQYQRFREASSSDLIVLKGVIDQPRVDAIYEHLSEGPLQENVTIGIDSNGGDQDAIYSLSSTLRRQYRRVDLYVRSLGGEALLFLAAADKVIFDGSSRIRCMGKCPIQAGVQAMADAIAHRPDTEFLLSAVFGSTAKPGIREYGADIHRRTAFRHYAKALLASSNMLTTDEDIVFVFDNPIADGLVVPANEFPGLFRECGVDPDLSLLVEPWLNGSASLASQKVVVFEPPVDATEEVAF